MRHTNERGTRPAGRIAVTAAVLLATCLASPAAGGPSSGESRGSAPDFEWSGKVARGGSIEIKNVNGSIEAVPASGDQVEVTAIKTAKRSDPDEVKIEVIKRPDGVTICTVYPSSRWGPHNRCGAGSRGHMNAHDSDVAVEYKVRVPAGIRFVGRSVNGAITARDLAGPIEAATVNGSVDIETSDVAEAETVNGSIHAALGSRGWSGPIEFKTVNGRIHVELPSDVGAEVRATTVNGAIDTDFPLTVRGRITGKRLSGTLGKGGGDLDLETVNGSIRLVAAR